MSEDLVRAHVFVHGRVQGVFFRGTAQDYGRSLNLTGWVRNLPDGRVEGIFEGTRERVEAMVEWCRHGPPHAQVEGLEVTWHPPTGEFTTLRVTY